MAIEMKIKKNKENGAVRYGYYASKKKRNS